MKKTMDRQLATVYALLMQDYGIPDNMAIEFFSWVNTSVLLFKESKNITSPELLKEDSK